MSVPNRFQSLRVFPSFADPGIQRRNADAAGPSKHCTELICSHSRDLMQKMFYCGGSNCWHKPRTAIYLFIYLFILFLFSLSPQCTEVRLVKDTEATKFKAHEERCGLRVLVVIFMRASHTARCFGLGPTFLQSEDGCLWARQAQLILSTTFPPPRLLACLPAPHGLVKTNCLYV